MKTYSGYVAVVATAYVEVEAETDEECVAKLNTKDCLIENLEFEAFMTKKNGYGLKHAAFEKINDEELENLECEEEKE